MFDKTALRSDVKIGRWLGLQHLKAEKLQGIGNRQQIQETTFDLKRRKQNLICIGCVWFRLIYESGVVDDSLVWRILKFHSRKKTNIINRK